MTFPRGYIPPNKQIHVNDNDIVNNKKNTINNYNNSNKK